MEAAQRSGSGWAPSTSRRSVSADAALALIVALGLPIGLYLAGLGPLNRPLYPATALLAGGYLYAKRSPWYVGLCLWFFCATPLARRLTDYQAGWDPSNPVLLAPYLACGWAALSLLRPRPWKLAAPFVAVLACTAWGLLLAVIGGRVLSGTVDAMKWSAGPLVALHLLGTGQREVVHRVVVVSLLTAAPAMALYGLAQYVSPPPWDAYWMVGAAGLGLDSIGQPLPFELRVFSTMNSPGPFGAVEMVGILLATRQALSVALPASLLMTLGLLLSQYRAIWVATAVGAIVVAASGGMRDKARIVLFCALLAVAGGSAALVPEVRLAIASRLQTLADLSTDASAEDRLHQYSEFLSPDRDLVLGEGLGINGSVRRLDGRNAVVIDSGVLEIIAAFGVLAGTTYLVSLASLAGTLFTRVARQCSDMPLYRAIVVATFVQLPFGTVQAGEAGFATWVVLGLAFAAVSAGAAEARGR